MRIFLAAALMLVGGSVYPNELDEELINKINDHMFKVVRETNNQLGGSKVDEYTTFRHVLYDPRNKKLMYTYSAMVDYDKLNSAQSDALYIFHKNKSCNGAFAPIIKSYGMKIEHVFEHFRTGRELWRKTYSSKECFGK